MANETLWGGLIAPLVVIGVWCTAIGLVGYLSGWQRLAQHYRATVPPVGKRWSFQYGGIGWADYNGVLTITAGPLGVFLSVFWLFRIGHPMLFIPWREFHALERRDVLWQHEIKAQIGRPPIATLRLPPAVFEQTDGRVLLTGER